MGEITVKIVITIDIIVCTILYFYTIIIIEQDKAGIIITSNLLRAAKVNHVG